MEKSEFKALKEAAALPPPATAMTGWTEAERRHTGMPTARTIRPFWTAARPSVSARRRPSAWRSRPATGPMSGAMALKAGDKVYLSNRGKSVLLAHIGEKSLAEGARIAAAHIDSPRLDLKPNPLYEDGELAYFKTHYYGGLRKYQWVTIPLELHGVVALRDGTTVHGEHRRDRDDPRLVITDLLPHLGAEQNKKPLGEAIPGGDAEPAAGQPAHRRPRRRAAG